MSDVILQGLPIQNERPVALIFFCPLDCWREDLLKRQRHETLFSVAEGRPSAFKKKIPPIHVKPEGSECEGKGDQSSSSSW